MVSPVVSTRRLRGLLLGCLLLGTLPSTALAASPVSEGAAAIWPGTAQVWEYNLYVGGSVRWQSPDYTACTAASTMGMLNLIAYSTQETLPTRAGGAARVDLIWHPDTSYGKQEEILRFERAHMSAGPWVDGTDPHGWRNALNQYGWGSVDADVYRDVTYSSFQEAAWAVVKSLARTHKPVGILAWFGGHAQFVSGYRVTGGDPRVSDNFTIEGVYLTDPWESDHLRNQLVAYDTWRDGPAWIRFDRYWQDDWTAPDPIDGKTGSREWRRNWVIEQPMQ